MSTAVHTGIPVHGHPVSDRTVVVRVAARTAWDRECPCRS